MKSANAPSDVPGKRAYNQGARARAAELTAGRILDVFARRIRDDWLDQITLDQIAQEADVTVPTVVRHFGGKDGLLAAVQRRTAGEIHARRRIAPGDVQGALAALIDDYEAAGDLVMRVLSQEERHAPFKAMADEGRREHRAWIAGIFAPWLDSLDAAARQARLDALVVATDLYVWKLLRRDMGRTPAETRALMSTLVTAAIGPLPLTPPASHAPAQEPRHD
ncbi:TetR/AcrR family transcriptional regulator [Xanthobacter sp. V4C-4]|uniref:TetR/AcrR family transcriptional regulator n=1 Tax=Xanthobacter cornucopiae TaxID=3119924 RepID=UPI0037287EC5